MADLRGIFTFDMVRDLQNDSEWDSVDNVWIFPDNDGSEFKYVDGTVTAAPAATPPAPTVINKPYILMDLYTPTMSTDTSSQFKGRWGPDIIARLEGGQTAIGSTVIYTSNVKCKDELQYQYNYIFQQGGGYSNSPRIEPIGAVAIHDINKIAVNLTASFGRDSGFNTVSTGIVGAGFSEGWILDSTNDTLHPEEDVYGGNTGQAASGIPIFRGPLDAEVNFIKQPYLPHCVRGATPDTLGGVEFEEGLHFGSCIAINEAEGKMAIGAQNWKSSSNWQGNHGRVYVMNTDGTGIKSCLAVSYGLQSGRFGQAFAREGSIGIGGGKVFCGGPHRATYYNNTGTTFVDNSTVGEVHVFDYNGVSIHSIPCPVNREYLYFGQRVYLSNDNSTLYVSDRGNTTNTDNQGGRVHRFNASNYSYLGAFDDDSLDSDNSYTNGMFGDRVVEVNSNKLLVVRSGVSSDTLFICDSDGSNMTKVEVPYYHEVDDAIYEMSCYGGGVFYNSNDQKTYFLAAKNFDTDGSYLIQGHVGAGNTFVVDSQVLKRSSPFGSGLASEQALQYKTVGITSNRILINSGGRNYIESYDYEVYTFPNPSDGFDLPLTPII